MSLLSDLGTRIGTQLKNKLDKTAKAADSDKFDGFDSSVVVIAGRGSIGTSTVVGDTTGFGNTPISGVYLRSYVGHSGTMAIFGGVGSAGTIGLEFTYNGDAYYHSNTDSNRWISHKMWTASNDGAGSGLDADKLDGLESTQFLRSDTSSTFTGNLTVTGTITSQVPTDSPIVQWAANGFMRRITDQGGLIVSADSSLVLHAGDHHTDYEADLGLTNAASAETLYLTSDSGITFVTNYQNGISTAKISTLNSSGDLAIAGNITSAGKPVMTGTKTISTSTPSGGSHGDVWYQV